MLPEYEARLEWDLTPKDMKKAIEEGKYSEEGVPLGVLTSASVNLKLLLEEEKKKNPENNLLDVIQVRLSDIIEDRFPDVIKINLAMRCSIKHQKERQ